MQTLEVSGKSAIVVAVPSPLTPPKETCFLAIPFSKELDPLSDLIMKAANKNGLLTIRTDQIQNDLTFTADFMHQIRSAKVVVAVLSPEPGSSKANANVLYEVGCAHALGKPTVLLTSDPVSVPSDIAHFYRKPLPDGTKPLSAGIYMSENLLSGNVTSDRIAYAIEQCIARMENPYIDPWWKDDIRFADHKVVRLLEPDFWVSFGKILSFSKLIQANMVLVEAHLDSLWRAAYEFQRAKGAKASQVQWSEVTSKWTDEYWVIYSKWLQPNVFAILEGEFAKVEACFNLLHKDADEQIDTAANRSQARFRDLKDTLMTYQGFHQAVDATIKGNMATFPGDANVFLGQVRNLWHCAKTCLGHVGELVDELLTVMR
jgi:nucleoside 2-deoxyribosyltransferase